VVYAPGVSQGTDSGMSESNATLEAPLVISVATVTEIALPVSPKRSLCLPDSVRRGRRRRVDARRDCRRLRAPRRRCIPRLARSSTSGDSVSKLCWPTSSNRGHERIRIIKHVKRREASGPQALSRWASDDVEQQPQLITLLQCPRHRIDTLLGRRLSLGRAPYRRDAVRFRDRARRGEIRRSRC